jgi:hypothetical protein
MGVGKNRSFVIVTQRHARLFEQFSTTLDHCRHVRFASDRDR